MEGVKERVPVVEYLKVIAAIIALMPMTPFIAAGWLTGAACSLFMIGFKGGFKDLS